MPKDGARDGAKGYSAEKEKAQKNDPHIWGSFQSGREGGKLPNASHPFGAVFSVRSEPFQRGEQELFVGGFALVLVQRLAELSV